MRVILFPFAKRMRNGKPHPKDYPYWDDLVTKLAREGHEVIQVGVEGERQIAADFRKDLSITDLVKLVHDADMWISVDSFGQHLGWDLGKPGIAIFGQSDPNIFGHPENINILKDRKYLRERQFWLWEQCDYNADAFVGPEVVMQAVRDLAR